MSEEEGGKLSEGVTPPRKTPLNSNKYRPPPPLNPSLLFFSNPFLYSKEAVF